MNRRVGTGLVLLAALAVPAGADGGDEASRLRAALAKREEQIRVLRQELARAAAAMAELQAALDKLKAIAGTPKAPPAGAPGQADRTLRIRVAEGDWGDSSLVDIEKVLRSAAGEIHAFCPQRRLDPIVVRRGKSGPITLYRRGPDGEYVVKLDSHSRRWAQMAYQFAHEFCHILTNYSKKAPTENKWFEESLCEMASLFALRRMARTWRTKPPWPNWKSYAASLGTYADETILPKDKRLAVGTTLGAWYRANAAALRANPADRARNKVVAAELLGLFEKRPQGWEAVGYLNLARPEAAKSFEAYLANWYRHTPDKHRPFVAHVIGLFEIKIPALPPEKSAAEAPSPASR